MLWFVATLNARATAARARWRRFAETLRDRILSELRCVEFGELRQGENHVGLSARETCDGLNRWRICPRFWHVAGKCILPRTRRQLSRRRLAVRRPRPRGNPLLPSKALRRTYRGSSRPARTHSPTKSHHKP